MVDHFGPLPLPWWTILDRYRSHGGLFWTFTVTMVDYFGPLPLPWSTMLDRHHGDLLLTVTVTMVDHFGPLPLTWWTILDLHRYHGPFWTIKSTVLRSQVKICIENHCNCTRRHYVYIKSHFTPSQHILSYHLA